MNGPIVEMRHISKSFPGVKALQDVDFVLYPGTVHGLVGENGAGKSTLMKILTGTYAAYEGEIFLEGQKVHFNNERERARPGHLHRAAGAALRAGTDRRGERLPRP